MAKTLIAAILVALTSSSAAADCLTKIEAQHKWKRQHVYWHGVHHCWDNLPAGASDERRASRDSPAPTTEPEPTIYYPEYKSNAAFGFGPIAPLSWRQPWFSPISIRQWPLLIDIDRVPFTTWTRRID